MSSATTHSPMAASAPATESLRPIPTLEQLRQWTAIPDERFVIPGVDWAFYEQLVDSIPEGTNIHVDYDGKDLEIMAQSPIHDVVKKTMARFVEFTADELEVPCIGLGQTTWSAFYTEVQPAIRAPTGCD